MNKHAAEKIASEYYNLGIQLAGGSLALKGARKVLNKNNPVERYLDLGVAQIPLGKARI